MYACVRVEEGFRGCDSKNKGREGQMQKKGMMEGDKERNEERWEWEGRVQEEDGEVGIGVRVCLVWSVATICKLRPFRYKSTK